MDAADRPPARSSARPGAEDPLGKEHDEGDVRLSELPSVVKFEKGSVESTHKAPTSHYQ